MSNSNSSSSIDNSIVQPTSHKDCLSPLVYVLLLAITIPVPYIRHVISLSASVLPGRTSNNTAVIGTIVQVILLAFPLLPLTLLWPNLKYRAIYRTWLLASCFSILMVSIYLIRPTADQLISLLHIGLFSIFSACLILVKQVRTRRPNRNNNEESGILLDAPNSQKVRQSTLWLFILLIATISYYPWLAWGALGSFLDAVIQIASGISIGFASMILLNQFTFRPPGENHTSFWSKYLLDGSAAAVTLLLLAGALAFPYGGTQTLLMLVLPGLGWSLVALDLLFPDIPSNRKTIPLIFLIGLIASAPLTMIDPDELILILNTAAGEILGKAVQAATVSLLIILCSNGILLLILFLHQRGHFSGFVSKLSSTRIRAFVGIAVLMSVIIGGWIYFHIGQTGFHGENMFVILKNQADVSAARNLSDYNQRRQFVYRSLTETANTSQKDLRSALDRLGIQYKPYYLVNGLLVPKNFLLRLWLSTHSEVDRILENPRLRPLPVRPSIQEGSESAPEEPQWNLTSIGADRVWEEFRVTGEGIVIGQSDSGVQGDHPELVDSYRGKNGEDDFNWYDPWSNTTYPNDIIGHGTHTLGSIVGEKTGVAPGATWIACINLERNLGNPAFYLDCMQFMLAPFPHEGDPLKDGDPSLGAHVLNNSWGCPDTEGCDPNTFHSAVLALRAAGIFFVAGAGNDGPSCSSLNVPPPIYQEAFAVGAMNRDGNLAAFSSIGPVTSDGSGRIKPDIIAPGVDILSSLPGSTYGYHSGTSMAGPHVVGVIALMWSANPNLIGDIEQTEQILIASANPYAGSLPNCPGVQDLPSTAVGYGIVDAYTAIKMAFGR